MRNRGTSWDHDRLWQAAFGGGGRATRRSRLHIATWLKKKRTPRKIRVDNLVVSFKKKRTPRMKKINCNLLSFFSTIFPSANYAVLISKRAEETVEDCDLFVCAQNERTLRPREKVEGGCDLVHNCPVNNQGSVSTEGFVAKNGGHFSPVQSQISHPDGNPLLYREQEVPTPLDQEKSIGSLVHEQGKEINPGESKSKEFPQYAQKKNETFSYPNDVRSLLATGLLEGFRVKYKKKQVEIDGYIRGCRYLCGCTSCNYTQVVTAFEFEKHSGMSSHNQNNSIYLHCGTNISLYKLVNKLKIAPLKPLDKLVEEIIHFPPNLECYEKWKASQNESEVQANIDNIQHCQQENHPLTPSPERTKQEVVFGERQESQGGASI